MDRNDFLAYNFTGEMLYTTSQHVSVERLCNGFTARNTGTTIVRVNDATLYPGVPGNSAGDSMTVGGNAGEIYVGNIKIQFDAGGEPQVAIIQKFYVE